MPETQTISESLTEEQRLELERNLLSRSFCDDEALLEEGKPAPGLYVLQRGRLAVLKRDMGKHQQLITELEAPVVVGELELLTGDVCSASVRARGPTEAQLLPSDRFNELLARGDAGAIQLMRSLARALGRKLAAANELYVDLAIWR
jgi:CRP-like cAMP-binding protein